MKKILLLNAGGTIACAEYGKGIRPELKADAFMDFIQLPQGFCELHTKDIAGVCRLDSSDMTPEDWKAIAVDVYHGLQKYDGVVVTHGTDTMAYTSSILSYMLRNLAKPVVLTGAQLPVGEAGSDGPVNLRDSIRVAVSGFAGVFVVFGGKIIDGTRASKLHSTEVVAFESVNCAVVGEVDDDVVRLKCDDGCKEVRNNINGLDKGVLNNDMNNLYVGDTCTLDTAIERNVFLLKLTPGISPDIIDLLVDKGYRGIVIEVFGVGGIPANLITSIRRALSAGVVIVATTQCTYGTTCLSTYETGNIALADGVLSAGNMVTEAVLTRVMWLLGHIDKVRKTTDNASQDSNNLLKDIGKQVMVKFDGKPYKEIKKECSQMSDMELLMIADAADFSSAPYAIGELADREHPQVKELVTSIVTDKKGDERMRAWAEEYIFDVRLLQWAGVKTAW